MFLHTTEIVQTDDPKNPRYVVRLPDFQVGIGSTSYMCAYAGCLALWLGFDRRSVEEAIADKERYL
jgi:hypothetical protein